MVPPPTDLDLACACAEGDDRAWEEFVDRYAPMVTRMAAKRLRMAGQGRDSDTIDDIVCEVFRSFLVHDRKLFRDYNPEYALSTWVGVITRTCIGRHLRKLGSRPIPSSILDVGVEELAPGSPLPGPVDRVMRKDTSRWVREQISRLSERDQKIIELFYYRNMEYQDIADTLEISINSVGAALSRARKRLARFLEDGSGATQVGDDGE